MYSLIFSTRGRAMKLKALRVSKIPILQMLAKTYCSIGPLREFCDWIATDPNTGKVSSADGWAKTKGGRYVADRWARWPKFASVVSSDSPLDTLWVYLTSFCLGQLLYANQLCRLLWEQLNWYH